MEKIRTSAIILAGGSGTRMGNEKPKQFMDILGKTVLERSVLAFDKSLTVDEIVVVVRESDLDTSKAFIESLGLEKPLKVTTGGSCRAESAKKGFATMDQSFDFVAVTNS